VERETIFFEPPSTSLDSRRLGVASFRNRKLDDDSKNQAGWDRGGLDQRGARMVAVGVIVGEYWNFFLGGQSLLGCIAGTGDKFKLRSRSFWLNLSVAWSKQSRATERTF